MNRSGPAFTDWCTYCGRMVNVLMGEDGIRRFSQHGLMPGACSGSGLVIEADRHRTRAYDPSTHRHAPEHGPGAMVPRETPLLGCEVPVGTHQHAPTLDDLAAALASDLDALRDLVPTCLHERLRGHLVGALGVLGAVAELDGGQETTVGVALAELLAHVGEGLA